jgi:hypothetical protein
MKPAPTTVRSDPASISTTNIVIGPQPADLQPFGRDAYLHDIENDEAFESCIVFNARMTWRYWRASQLPAPNMLSLSQSRKRLKTQTFSTPAFHLDSFLRLCLPLVLVVPLH